VIYIEILLFFLCVFLLTVIFIILNNRRSKALKKERMDKFKSFLSGLGLEYEIFHGRIYGYGRYKNHYISFKYLPVDRGGLSPFTPGCNHCLVLCRIKIPGTEGMKFYLTVLSRKPSNRRNSPVWINPEPRFYIALSKGQPQWEALDIFNKLSAGTKRRMIVIAERYNEGCTVSADWEKVMIGRDNALKLVYGRDDALSMLDFQMRIPLNTSCGDLIDYLDLSVNTVQRLSEELRGK